MSPKDFTILLKSYRLGAFSGNQKYALWTSNDTLVEIESNGYTERGRKYELKNIQGVVHTPTLRNMIRSIFGSIVVLIFLVSLIASSSILVLAAIVGVLLVISVVMLVFILIEGPSCKVLLVTAVGEHELKSVGNLKRMKILLLHLRRRIVDIQGPLDESEIEMNIDKFDEIVTRTSKQPKKSFSKKARKINVNNSDSLKSVESQNIEKVTEKEDVK